MTVSRRSFLSGLLATATAPALPPLPATRGIAYLVLEEIPLERFGNRDTWFRPLGEVYSSA